MYKALKDNKIIAISETDTEFLCLDKDKVMKDTLHSCEDYGQYDGEYLLLEDIPAPTHEEQSAKREEAYRLDVDPITCHINRLRDEEPTQETVERIAELIADRDMKVAEIKAMYPYPDED